MTFAQCFDLLHEFHELASLLTVTLDALQTYNVALSVLEPGRAVDLGDGVSVTALAVPHRDEYTDTVGFIIRGPRQRVLYVPDTEGWDAWEPGLPEVLEELDVAIIDGTFYSGQELPGRDLDRIGHPLIVESLELLEPLEEEAAVSVLVRCIRCERQDSIETAEGTQPVAPSQIVELQVVEQTNVNLVRACRP